ncbi:hypothetical protein TIFTF001_024081 [Ficus carica]|uniref:Uncharacterized protein n=1 Tax=Ficus carica TaxID=3494 RepID=A0AA88AFY3_FICCA|nr:hypothetical protein TIFTF001_024081 [Ficus carica]
MDQIHEGSREVHGGSRWRISWFAWSPAAALVRDGEARDSAERLTAARALNGDGFAGGKVLGAGEERFRMAV